MERYVSISYSFRTLCFWTFLMLVLIHWFCCAWGLVAQEQGTQRTPGLETAQVRATLEVHEHYPLRLEWRAACAQ